MKVQPVILCWHITVHGHGGFRNPCYTRPHSEKLHVRPHSEKLHTRSHTRKLHIRPHSKKLHKHQETGQEGAMATQTPRERPAQTSRP